MQILYKADGTPINLLQDSDIEYGSNERGYYEKHSNGVLIQWGSINKDVKNWIKTGTSGLYYSDNYLINFPVPFVGEYSISAYQTKGIILWIYSLSNLSQSSASISLLTDRDRGNENLSNLVFVWQAIGRWK